MVMARNYGPASRGKAIGKGLGQVKNIDFSCPMG